MSPLSKFAKSMGLVDPFRITYSHTETGSPGRVELTEAYTVLGSWPGCGVLLKDRSISRKHAYLQFVAGRPFVTDLGSRTGLRFGDEPAAHGWWLPGQTLKMGNFELRYESAVAESGDATPPTAASLPGSSTPLVLVLTGDSHGEVYCPLQAVLTLVGQSPRCTLRVNDSRVSPFHAAVVQTDTKAWLIDLFAYGGTWVNGRPIRHSPLVAGDRLSLNGYLLEVQQQAERAPQHPSPAVALPPSPPAPSSHDRVPQLTDPPNGDIVAEIRQYHLTMAKLLTSLQQEQARLARQQCDVIELLATAIREGRLPIGPPHGSNGAAHHAYPAGEADPIGPPVHPPIQPSRTATPDEEAALNQAHSWLLARFGALGKTAT